MSPPIVVELTHRPLERVEAEIAVAGFFSDERPLRGGAGRADWRLCGGLSRRIEAGDLAGRSGEALLIGCGRALRAPRLLLLGLGARSEFDASRLRDEIRGAVLRCRGLRCARVGLSPLGLAPDDLPRHAPALVAGLRAAWSEDSESSGREGPPELHLQLCVPSRELSAVARALGDARRAAGDEGLEIVAPSEASREPVSGA